MREDLKEIIENLRLELNSVIHEVRIARDRLGELEREQEKLQKAHDALTKLSSGDIQ